MKLLLLPLILDHAGPLSNTVVDFWKMVWQERTQVIVMVTKLVEEENLKCNQYWPSSQLLSESYGPFSVSLLEEQVMPDIVMRKMKTWVRA